VEPAQAAAQIVSAPRPGVENRRVNLGAVKRWLEDPFTHRIEAALGNDDSEEMAEALLDEEPFTTAFLDRLGLVRTLWDTAINDFAERGAGGVAALCAMPDDEKERTWRGYFETAYGTMRLECRTPEGFLGAIDKTDLFGEVKDYLQGLWDGIRAVDGLASVEMLRVGRGSQAGAPPREGIVFDNVHATGQKVVLEGAPRAGFWEGDTTNPQKILHLFVAVYPGLGRDKKARYCLLPWLSAQAAAVAQGRDFTCAIHLIDREKQEKVLVDIQHKAAAAYLETMLAEYCGGAVVEHLPLQAVESIVQDWRLSLEEIDNGVVKQWLDTDSGSQYRRYKYYSEFIDLLQPPVSGNARETLKRRLGPLIDACYPQEVPAAGEGEAACSGK
jgi:hypothetical protein